MFILRPSFFSSFWPENLEESWQHCNHFNQSNSRYRMPRRSATWFGAEMTSTTTRTGFLAEQSWEFWILPGEREECVEVDIFLV
jgi:hypothetical protein